MTDRKQKLKETLSATSNELFLSAGWLAIGGTCFVKGIENGSAPEIAAGSLMSLGSAAIAGAGLMRHGIISHKK